MAGLAARRAWADGVITLTFGLTLGFMNFAIYQAFARIPLGIAVTIEFLGPLSVTVAGTLADARRASASRASASGGAVSGRARRCSPASATRRSPPPGSCCSRAASAPST